MNLCVYQMSTKPKYTIGLTSPNIKRVQVATEHKQLRKLSIIQCLPKPFKQNIHRITIVFNKRIVFQTSNKRRRWEILVIFLHHVSQAVGGRT